MCDTDSEQETEVFFNLPTSEDQAQVTPQASTGPCFLTSPTENSIQNSSFTENDRSPVTGNTESCNQSNVAEAVHKMVQMQTHITGVLKGIADTLTNMNSCSNHPVRAEANIHQLTQAEQNQNESCRIQPRMSISLPQQTVPQREPDHFEPRNQTYANCHQPRYRECRNYSPSQPCRGDILNQHEERESVGSFRPQHRQNRQNRSGPIKIPPFCGKEDWRVWFNRFEAVANRQGWNSEDKLDELLPKLQGSAGDFVFTQLRPEALNNYHLLVAELNCRFRAVETSKTFAAKFSNRNQKSGETAEEYASELKCLYDKAHKGRDIQTRQEDLVRRFLDGLRDDEVRCEVEYVKDPCDIDEAVFHVVNYIQTRKRISQSPYGEKKMKKFVRSAKNSKCEEGEGDSDEEYACQVRSKPTKLKEQKQPQNQNKQIKDTELIPHQEPEMGNMLKQILDKISLLTENNTTRKPSKECYNCHKPGHFIRDCPQRKHSTYRRQTNSQENMMCPSTSRNHLNENGLTQMAEVTPQ